MPTPRSSTADLARLVAWLDDELSTVQALHATFRASPPVASVADAAALTRYATALSALSLDLLNQIASEPAAAGSRLPPSVRFDPDARIVPAAFNPGDERAELTAWEKSAEGRHAGPRFDQILGGWRSAQ